MKKKKKEFSKVLLIQESALIWITTLVCLALGFYCIQQGFIGSLPWLSSIIISTWTAYGVSQAMYYRKSMKENTAGGIKYDSVMEEIRQTVKTYNNVADSVDYSMYEDGTDPYAGYSESNEESYEATENVDEY